MDLDLKAKVICRWVRFWEECLQDIGVTVNNNFGIKSLSWDNLMCKLFKIYENLMMMLK